MAQSADQPLFFDLHGFIKSKRGVVTVAKKTKPLSPCDGYDSDDPYMTDSGMFWGADGSSWTRGRRLGSGTSASVYLAKTAPSSGQDSLLPPEVAVKSSFMEFSSPLRSEKEILMNLQSCYNIVHCYGDEITETCSGEVVYNLILEYCSGSSLHNHIFRLGPLPESEVRRYTMDLVHGLNYIHRNFYIHCDIKPENILLTPGDGGRFRAKIGDFGLAKKMTPEVIGELRGTGPYMSPELVREGLLDWPADIWALGCVVLEMMTGKQAWSSGINAQKHQNERVGSSDELPEIPSEISAAGRDFLERCFRRSPYTRTPSWLLVKHPYVKSTAL